MARAGYCSVCGETTWLAPDGSCVKGHPPEYISGAYDVAESDEPAAPPVVYPEQIAYDDAPASEAYAQAAYVPPAAEHAAATPTPQRVPVSNYVEEKPRGNRTPLLIAVAIIAVVLCMCAAAFAFYVLPAVKSIRSAPTTTTAP